METYRAWTAGSGGMWIPGYVTTDLDHALTWVPYPGLSVYRMTPTTFGDFVAGDHAPVRAGLPGVGTCSRCGLPNTGLCRGGA